MNQNRVFIEIYAEGLTFPPQKHLIKAIEAAGGCVFFDFRKNTYEVHCVPKLTPKTADTLIKKITKK